MRTCLGGRAPELPLPRSSVEACVLALPTPTRRWGLRVSGMFVLLNSFFFGFVFQNLNTIRFAILTTFKCTLSTLTTIQL